MFDILIKSLIRIFNDSAYLSIVLDEVIKNKLITDKDKGLFTKILYGVCEKKIYLDYLTSDLTRGKRLKPYIRNAVRIGIYSIEFLNVKDYYIVNELVETVKKKDFNSSKFVNGIFRSYLRGEKTDINKLTGVERISTELSIPFDLCNFLYKQYGSDIYTFFNEPSSINTYRINTLKNDSKDLCIKYLEDNFISYEINGVILKSSTMLLNTELFRNGFITMIDESSYKVAEVLNPSLNDTILDTCSAPGGKSLSISALMNNTGKIYSYDIYPEKLKLINDNILRLGVKNIETRLGDATNTDYQRLFDKVLVDAPCSGLGTINHKPDLKYHINLDDIKDIEILQRKILDNASKYVLPGGILVYSTCTINKKENTLQIKNFLNEHTEYKMLYEEQITPNSLHDGFYICKLQRNK